MKTSSNTTSAAKPLKSSPNFCSTHTKLLKTAFKTLFFFFFRRCGIQQCQKITFGNSQWGRIDLSAKREEKAPKKPHQGVQNISKWRLHSAGSALREDGDIYMDFLGTHPTRHDPRVLQAELFQPRLNTEESKKNPTISALRVCFSSGPGRAPQAKSAACFGRGKQNSIRAGFRVVLFQNNPQEADILLFQQGNIGTSKEKQGPAHLWLWAARKTICREHILPIPACSWEKGRNIIPHLRIH